MLKINFINKNISIKKPIKWVKFQMEQVNGIEPSSQPWQGRILAAVLHLHYVINNTKYLMILQQNLRISMKLVIIFGKEG